MLIWVTLFEGKTASPNQSRRKRMFLCDEEDLSYALALVRSGTKARRTAGVTRLCIGSNERG
eukprot:6213196-Pleurochrysis_carterae.AAC.4